MWDSALSFKQHQPQVKVATFEAILSDKTAEARQSEEQNAHQCRPVNINRGGEIGILLDGTISRYNQIVRYLLACCLQVKPDV